MATGLSLPHKLRQAVEGELADGERLHWWAQPRPRRLAIKALPLVLFGIPWTAFALFWMWGASGFGQSDGMDGPASYFFLFGVPFVMIGIGMLTSPLWMARKARRTVYAISDWRAIIFEPGMWGSMNVRSFRPVKLTDLERKQRSDGSGDIIFQRDVSVDSEGHRRTKEIGFVGIDDVKGVETVLKTLVETTSPGQ